MQRHGSFVFGNWFRKSFLCAAVAVAVLLGFGPALVPGHAALFPARGDDVMSSMGVFKVVVEPPFRSLLAPDVGFSGYPGYLSADGRLTSPLLLDFATTVGRSDAYARPLAGTVDVGLPTMGLQGYGDYPYTPFIFGFAPVGTRELLTQIRSFALATSIEGCRQDPRVPFVPINWTMVSAGPGQGVPRKSVGMVQRRADALAGNDFPARSFFDIFVEVNLPPVPATVSGGIFPGTGAVLYNDSPLVITNLNLNNLPPHVVYIHGDTTAVPLKFRDANLPYWNANDVFGYVVLSGHGTQVTNCFSEGPLFLDTVLGPIGGRPANELPLELPFPSDKCPPPGSTFDAVKEIDVINFAVPGVGVVQGRNFSHGGLNNPITPPPLNGTAIYSNANTFVDLEFSLDNGASWTPGRASGGVAASIRHTQDTGGTQLFDTEMLSLNIANAAAGFQLRESPTRQSLGKHTVRPGNNGNYFVSSFFDVFLDLSIDGGASWVPANRAIRVQLAVPCETNPPTVVSIGADCDQSVIVIKYSEPMDAVSTANAGNYSLSGGATVVSVTMNLSQDTVTLNTVGLNCATDYTLTIRSVKDKCGNAIRPNPTIVSFTCAPCPQVKVSKWSQFPAYIISPTAGVQRGEDRWSDFDWVKLMQSGTTIAHPNWIIADDFRSDGRPIRCVRWWGSYARGFEPVIPTPGTAAPVYFEDGFVLSFFSDTPATAAGGFSRPNRLLGTYVAPMSAVRVTATTALGCDTNRIYQYEVDLSQTCLDHAFQGLARPQAFLEKSNSVYWIAIAAEVGHQIIPVRDTNGTIVDWLQQTTNKRATNHFWGWHTAPTNNIDRSVMGHVLMQGTNWIYPQSMWMPNPVLCNEIDQAFQLLTAPFLCPNPPPIRIARTATGGSVVISWPGSGFTLQCTPSLANPSENTPWVDVSTTSPVTLPLNLGTARFYRLICP